jgi:hypothetical protein
MNGLTNNASCTVYICSDGVLWLRDRLLVVASEVDGALWFQDLIVFCDLKDRLGCVAS